MIPNIKNNTNIAFLSAYKVSNHNNSKDGFLKFESLCSELEDKDNTAVWFDESISSKDLIWHKMYTLVVDDSKDNEVETYCSNHGIVFNRYNKNQASDIEKIKDRITPPLENVALREVDAKKLVEIANRQDSNLIKNEIEYKKSAKQRTDNMIKSGLMIPTSTLRIMNNDPEITSKEAIEKLKQNSGEKLKNRQLSIDFIQMTNEPDDLMFYALRDMGMKNVPLYMDKQTLEFANALDILA